MPQFFLRQWYSLWKSRLSNQGLYKTRCTFISWYRIIITASDHLLPSVLLSFGVLCGGHYLILKGTSDLNSTMFSFIYFPLIRNFTQMGWFHIVMGWGSKSCFFFHRRRHDCLGFGGLEFLVNGKIWNVVVIQAVDGHCPEGKRAVRSRDTLLIGINATPASI